MFVALLATLLLTEFWGVWQFAAGTVPGEPSLVLTKKYYLEFWWVSRWFDLTIPLFLFDRWRRARRELVCHDWYDSDRLAFEGGCITGAIMGVWVGIGTLVGVSLVISLAVAFLLKAILDWIAFGPCPRPVTYVTGVGFAFAWPVKLLAGVVVGLMVWFIWLGVTKTLARVLPGRGW